MHIVVNGSYFQESVPKTAAKAQVSHGTLAA